MLYKDAGNSTTYIKLAMLSIDHKVFYLTENIMSSFATKS